jgi:hypothetical protein
MIAVEMGYQAGGCPDGARTVHDQVGALLANFLRLADRLALAEARGTLESPSSDTLRGAALACLRRWRNDERAGRGALAVVMAGEWVENLARVQADLERPVALAAEAARTPWWR